MKYIDEKFKDNDPKSTVQKIQNILQDIGVETTEQWNQSGVEHCHSLCVFGKNGMPSSNGKGVTEDLARASAYGEFIERLQNGLFYYKYQSIIRQENMSISAFAPDIKYMTAAELLRDGDWMDYLVEAYPGVTRESIVEHAKAFACAEDDKIPTIPFYSLFEDKYVWIPSAFQEQIYASNGCCAGNTREEAWVHGLSEIMERHCTLHILKSGKAAPKISDEILSQYPTVSEILKNIREAGEYEVDIFDFSLDYGFPVISTRIISKKDHSYRVNVAADPVLEIALQRTLTEMFQGVHLRNVAKKHNGRILASVNDYPVAANAINQLENGTGFFTADYFADGLGDAGQMTEFAENSNKNNKELLQYMLDLYRKIGKPIYVRNLSFLGFPTYRILVPGFSETKEMWLSDVIPEYSIADEAARVMRNVAAATDEDLSWMMNYHQTIRGRLGRYNNFSRISGVPIAARYNALLVAVTRAYASYRLKQYQAAVTYIASAIGVMQHEDQEYFRCVNKYLEWKQSGISEDKIRIILYKFFEKVYADKLYEKLDNGQTPYEDYLVACDFAGCDSCQYASACGFRNLQELNKSAGKKYREFINGQDREFLSIN